MLIDLSEVLSEPHKSIDEVVGTEMKEVKVNGSRFPVSRTQPVHIHVEYAGEKKLHISCETSLTVIIPCDRCLTDVPTDFTLSFEKQVNTALADGEDDGESDEANYIDGYASRCGAAALQRDSSRVADEEFCVAKTVKGFAMYVVKT